MITLLFYTEMIYLLLYLTIIGIVSFVLFGVDKHKALKAKRRISENTLLSSVAFGGWIGGVIGMTYFHHKTLKTSFLRKFRSLVGVRLIITIIVLFLQ